MSLAIFQIGDLPLFFNLKQINDDEVELKADRSWRNAKVEFTGVPGSHVFNDPLRPLPEQQEIQLSGGFVCESSSARQNLSRLMSMGGIANTPIIGFHYEECDHENDSICCSDCNNTLDWIVTYGIITKISQTGNPYSSKRPWTNMVIPVEISMILNPKWRALNAWEWEYRRSGIVLNPIDPNLSRDSLTNQFVLPLKFNDLTKQGSFFKWGLSLSKYDPNFWADKYKGLRFGGYGINFSNISEYPFLSDPSLWSAPPNSVYAFTEFSNVTGSIGIEITRNSGYFAGTGVIETSTLDLATLNTDLLAIGQGGLNGTDIIITGYASPFPGFIVRDDEIIPNIRPRWSYLGNYPGETGRGYNNVNFTSDNVSCKVAFLHDFGLY